MGEGSSLKNARRECAHATRPRHRAHRLLHDGRSLRRLRGRRVATRLALVLAAGPAFAGAGELGVNVYGLSYHFERGRARELGFDNELNPGLGLRYRVPAERFDWFLDGGAYRDSGRNTAKYAGAGAFWKATKGLRLGGAVAFFHSDTYNQGEAFIAPVPLAAYEWRALTLNVVYFPKVSGINDINTLGFWITVWMNSGSGS